MCIRDSFFILSVVFSIIAAMAANKGEEYTYPLIPQMVSYARYPCQDTWNPSRRRTTVSASRPTAQGQDDPARSLCARPSPSPSASRQACGSAVRVHPDVTLKATLNLVQRGTPAPPAVSRWTKDPLDGSTRRIHSTKGKP